MFGLRHPDLGGDAGWWINEAMTMQSAENQAQDIARDIAEKKRGK